MKGLRSIPRVLKINRIEGRSLSLLFNNGESKLVNIEQLLTQPESTGHAELRRQILETDDIFNTVTVLGNTIGWPTVGLHTTDLAGNSIFASFDIDPIVLYEAGRPDEANTVDLGGKIRTLRLSQGLTQEALARKSGTSKHYISRLENSKSDIELLTLKKIVEAGLDRRLSIEIS